MLASIVATFLAAAAIVSAQTSSLVASAPVVTNNPIGANYNANLPVQTKNAVRGSVVAQSNPDGKGVLVNVAIAGLPLEGGPFMYHIHEKPVPTDGNCTGTGAHLDPYKRGEVPACDSTKKETCQVGDLSGKWGNITAQSLSASYVDEYISTNPADPAYFGKLSIVVHSSNKTRLSCGNFTTIQAGDVSTLKPAGPSSGYALPTGASPTNNTLSLSATATGTGGESAQNPTATPPAPNAPSAQPSSGAQKVLAGAGALMGAAAFAMLL
ncbi:superoxide dismutase [Lophiotrema nucula]|uniref:superoxide dismutase n=1 Tax=Lophiotrema nucula TaxID=690887 RepID=A0A6A5ZLS2_9PLEO|nr:superoxide dismutase [Lophiotrema nucula]